MKASKKPHHSHVYSYDDSKSQTLCKTCGIEPIGGEWYIGDDDDCETCGMTYNSLTFEEWDNGEYQFYLRVGCYGGDEYQIDEIDQLIDDIKEYENFDADMEKDIRRTVNLFKERWGI